MKECVRHRGSKSKLYYVWKEMRKRCGVICGGHDTDLANYKNRGISICDEWRTDFKSFYNWALANGYKEGLTLDRINNDGNYEPSNCRWAPKGEQQHNTRRNIKVECYTTGGTFLARYQSMAAVTLVTGINYSTLRSAMREGRKLVAEDLIWKKADDE